MSGCGDRFVNTLGLSHAGTPPGLLEMMIRGAFLDGSAYRLAAADTNGNGSAFIALLISSLAGVVGGLLMTFRYVLAGRGALVLLVSAIVGVISLLVSIGVMAAFSQVVVRRKLDFGQLFRGLAYAESPGVLAIIPVLGTLLSLWRIVTSLVAIREISGADMARSAGLLVIGIVGSIVAGVILSPLLLSTLALRSW